MASPRPSPTPYALLAAIPRQPICQMEVATCRTNLYFSLVLVYYKLILFRFGIILVIPTVRPVFCGRYMAHLLVRYLKASPRPPISTLYAAKPQLFLCVLVLFTVIPLL
jgi:hypothetical protein